MKPASIDDIKKELLRQPPKKVLELLLKVARFKKENKELLTYLLFESDDEQGYVESIKLEIDEIIAATEGEPYTASKKILRKIPRIINKQIRYIGNKNSAADLHLHLATRLRETFAPDDLRSLPEKMIMQQLNKLSKLLVALPQDTQHDITRQMDRLQPATPEKKRFWKRR